MLRNVSLCEAPEALQQLWEDLSLHTCMHLSLSQTASWDSMTFKQSEVEGDDSSLNPPESSIHWLFD